jgi:predicted HTH transcriptional regulator
MRAEMLDHGLEPPLLGTDTGYFQVTFHGPADDLDRLRVPESRLMMTPAVEAQLNERQKKMVLILVQGEELTSRRCEAELGITRETANRDFSVLIRLGLARKEGQGRTTRYVLENRT